MASSLLACAAGSTNCKDVNLEACKGCRLVMYCSRECQKSHWPLHRKDCRSPLSKESWQPEWALQGRMPAFMRGGIGVSFGAKKFLWGNVPALDVVKLEANEGSDYAGPLRLLFAASGDFRNVIKSIAQLPPTYTHPVEVTMNDRDIDIVARNAIMLLALFAVEDVDQAIDCVLHVWYSALIRDSDLAILQQQIRPLIAQVCDKIKDKKPDSIQAKTWTFGRRSLRLLLEKSAWDKLLSYTSVPEGLTAERAGKVRTAVTLAESRKDYRDRNLLLQATPARRIAMNRFREDGLLLPFGEGRDEFRQPNPTFFQTVDEWPMKDNADPLNGWSLREVEQTLTGAKADIYGKLFYYVRAVLRAFAIRVTGMQVSFRLFQMGVTKLPEHLENGGSFNRIEVSNISDRGYLGPLHTVVPMTPLLQGPLSNPHATLITLFMNAVDETITQREKMAQLLPSSVVNRRLEKYCPIKGLPSGTTDPQMIKFDFARDCVGTYDDVFDRFLNSVPGISEARQFIGAVRKEEHTVVEKWPFRLKLRPGQTGAQDEFDRLLGGGVSGKERYVEWKRIAVYADQSGNLEG